MLIMKNQLQRAVTCVVMSDAKNQIETPADSRETFVRHLRDKARQATEASVHHASMSQQYLDLSQKFSQLAQQAGSAELEDLRSSLAQLEGQTPGQSSVAASQAMPMVSGPAPSDAALESHLTSSAAADVSPAAGVSAPSPPEVTSPAEPALAGDAVDHSSANNGAAGKRGRRTTTRKIVERARKAKLAAKGRVRVKAKKADLAPKQRSATEELNNSKGSLATSMALFALAVFLLSLITFQFEPDIRLDPIMAGFASEVTPVEEPLPVEPPEEEPGEQTGQETPEPVEEEQPEEEPEPEEEKPEEPVETPAEMAEAEPADLPEPEVMVGEPSADAQASTDVASVDNRSDAGRKMMLQKYGGSQASESAVQRGLEWLLTVQHPQGYWDFIAVGPSANAGTINNPIGGTAYALLPFLAAGQTHQSGDYQKQVGAGLTFLTKIGVNARAGYDLRGMVNKNSDDKEPNEAYYVHGAATLTLCEAYGMTKDRRLKKAAEGAVRFIVNSQDPRGGGWRYNPQDPGSTSVTVIQLMALMSAKKAGLKVPEASFKGVMHYLDSVQVDKAGRYGYEIQKKTYTSARTAMALLCRMYLGWGRDDGDMRAGIALLDKAGPYDNMYSLYFATQVMRNWGGKEWERWNVRMRDDLVATQETEGPAAGSWAPRTGALHAKQGGRLLTTALATLTLEVYYRYKPLLPEPGQPVTPADPQ